MKYGHVSDSSQSKSTYKHKGISNVKKLSEALYEKILEEGKIENSTNVVDAEMEAQDEAGSSVDETLQHETSPSDGSPALQDDKAVQQQQEELGPSDDQPSQDEEAFQHEESQELFGGEQEVNLKKLPLYLNLNFNFWHPLDASFSGTNTQRERKRERKREREREREREKERERGKKREVKN